jgi:hypothetical protein
MTTRMAWLAAGAAVMLSVRLWHAHQHAVLARELETISDGKGFIPVQMPDNAPPDKVVILAPEHCSSDVAKRADALAQFLTDQGIPNVRSSTYMISRVTPEMMPGIERAHSLDPPVVLVNGRGKSNPSAEEVVGEYRSDHP